MTFLPILEREVRVLSRSRATYWVRFVVALVGLLACLPQLLMSGPVTPASIGSYVFDGIVGAALVLSCGACLVTADAISSERREGTLGLLFLTRVRAFDVLVGKFGSIGLSSLCAMVAFLPVLMLPLLAGGVTGGEALRKGLVLIATLIFSLAAGLLASAFASERFKAARMAVFIVVLVLFVPISALSQAGDARYRIAPGRYWTSLAGLLVFSLGLMFVATIQLRRAVRDPGDLAEPLSFSSSGQAAAATPLSRWRPVEDGASPVEWLVRQQRGIKATLWAAALFVLFSSSGSMFLPWLFYSRARFSGPYLLQLPSLVLAVICGALLAWAASRFFIEARRSGQLELLQTTPLGAATLVSAQWNSLKRLLVGPVAIMALTHLLPFTMGFLFWRGPSLPYGLPLRYFVSQALSLVNMFLGVGALCWLGMWFGWKARGQAGAIVWTVALGKGVPLLLYAMGMAMFYLLISRFIPATLPGGGMPLAYAVTSWLPQLAILLFYLVVIREARRGLLNAVASGAPSGFNLAESLLNAKREAVCNFRRARHWTPS